MDRRLWWDDHVQRKIAEGKKLLNVLLSATRGNWGPRPEIAKWIYTAIIRPSISYGASVWAHDVTLKKTTSMMTSLDRAALASMAAFRPSTPTQGLAVLLGLQPLDLHLRETAMMSTIRHPLLSQMTWNGQSETIRHATAHRRYWHTTITSPGLPLLTDRTYDTAPELSLIHI